MSIKVLDLFAGAGGLTAGLESVKDSNGKQVFELLRAVEVNKYACETLRTNFGAEKVIEGDLTDKTIHHKVIAECRGKVDVIAGGIPCQSFSLIGPRSGYGLKDDRFKQDRRDDLYKEFRTIVEELIPKVVLIENVKGILSKRNTDGQKIIEILLSDFEDLGYHFSRGEGKPKYTVLNAADFGVPQLRERVIIIGIHRKWKEINVPEIEATHYDPKAAEAEELKKQGKKPRVTTGEAIGDLPRVCAKVTYTGMDETEKENQHGKNRNIQSGKEKVPFNQQAFSNYLKTISDQGRGYFQFVRPNGYHSINYHMARAQQMTDIELFRSMGQGETAKRFIDRDKKRADKLIKYNMDTFEDKYRKQKWNAQCTTIFAHLEKDGNRFIHPRQARTFTPREAARIQSFPDDYIIEGPYGKKLSQIGNAVPPLLANVLGQYIHKMFTGVSK